MDGPRRAGEQKQLGVVDDEVGVLQEQRRAAGEALQGEVRQEEGRRAGQVGRERRRERARVVGQLRQRVDDAAGQRDDDEAVLPGAGDERRREVSLRTVGGTGCRRRRGYERRRTMTRKMK